MESGQQRQGGNRMDRLQHPLFARAFAKGVAGMDRRGAADHRRRILAGLHGSVIEIGAGAGSSFALYPPAVSHVLALEPDDYLRGVAQMAAASASVPVTVVDAAAEQIPAENGSADAVVASLVLCSVKDQAAVLAEIRRVLRPGGTLAFYEHVRSAHPFLGRTEDVLTPVWGRFMGGCHLNRDTLAAITAAGFTVQDHERFGFAVQRFNPPIAHILGHATSPGPANSTPKPVGSGSAT
ncbi:ubiquinone/menaquinone biosynthesis C-methylase UbiE [Pseudarthrobacter defluvii]|uniref:class I SAM-dependent methyltransferase n=1 Tax=Pseudarthrobacter defluvii TaxID=410837 RepID=UPI0027812D4D|nr:class I SAM-dependent methyltransferase [Pseudarthrobacter defluvii]MDQ0770178.1 ubiquinone/menaquinone biosynthesis C-methylase UbiE [Pseudarthrobacter defluvii]